MARQLPPKPPSPKFQQPGQAAPVPDEPVPFPAGGGGPPARTGPKRQRNEKGHYVPAQSQANGNHQPPFFPQGVQQQYQQAAQEAAAVIGQHGLFSDAKQLGETEIDGSFDYAPESRPVLPPLLDDERQSIDSLEMIRLASDTGMVDLATHTVNCLSQFRREFFNKHQRIMSLSQAWSLLAGTVNLALPEE